MFVICFISKSMGLLFSRFVSSHLNVQRGVREIEEREREKRVCERERERKQDMVDCVGQETTICEGRERQHGSEMQTYLWDRGCSMQETDGEERER